MVRQHPDTADQSSGYFVVEDADVAEDLIPYEGVRVYGRELFFLVDSIEEFMLDPIREDELKFKAYCPKDVKGTHQENS